MRESEVAYIEFVSDAIQRLRLKNLVLAVLVRYNQCLIAFFSHGAAYLKDAILCISNLIPVNSLYSIVTVLQLSIYFLL